MVEAVSATMLSQPMFNLTVDTAHTFFVGEGNWLVHNTMGCDREAVSNIYFTQESYSQTGIITDSSGNVTGTYSVEDNAKWLRNHPDEDLPWGNPIRIFRKDASMNDWPVVEGAYGIGDPKNLLDGQLYTLDNRRLEAYRMAGRTTIPVQRLDLNNPIDRNIIFSDIKKFTTPNWGVESVGRG